jgi:hypothetical protein
VERSTKEELEKWWHAQCPKCGWVVVDDYVEPDAQAAIAALQARVRELEARQHFGACAKCLTNAWRICKEGTPDAVEMKCSNGSTWWLCDYCLSKEQLTQRTAELEAAKAIQAIDMKNNNAYREQVANLQAELEAAKRRVAAYDRWLSAGVYYTNAEFEEQINVRVNQRNALTDLKQQVAQLREERDEAMQYAAGMDNDLQKIGAQHAALLGLVCELPLPVGELFIKPDVPASLEPMWWQVRIRNQYGFSLMLAEFRDKQIAKAFLAIMTYRATLPRVGGAQS